MSRARHKHRAGGGKVHWNAGEGQPAAKEAEEKKHGGKVHMHGEGEHAKHRGDKPKRAHGGKVHVEHHKAEEVHHHHKHGGKIPGRKRGGRIGADTAPLTTAARVKHVTKGEEPEEGVPSD